jgi:uncharacterized membrane-anchored protein
MVLSKQIKFILAIAIQVAIILAIILFKLAVLTSGTDVFLRIIPVDPRDLLRGDYLTFQYEISNADPYLLWVDPQIRNGDTVYVVLRKSGKYWTAQEVQKTKPLNYNQIYIRAKVAGGLGSKTGLLPNQRPEPSPIHLVYGLEEYYIPEGIGSGLNLWTRDKEVSARVVVDEDGNAVLKQIYLDGKPWP